MLLTMSSRLIAFSSVLPREEEPVLVLVPPPSPTDEKSPPPPESSPPVVSLSLVLRSISGPMKFGTRMIRSRMS